MIDINDTQNDEALRKEKEIEFVKKLLKEDVDIKFIESVTGVSVEEIRTYMES